MSWQERKHRAPVGDGLEMAYIDEGEGPTVVLLHGNPTSSYLWRDVVPPLVAAGSRCVAPDLIGMGDSDPLPDSGPGRYTFADHTRYLDAFLERIVGPEPVTLVVHDWGSGLGFHWANRHRDRVTGIAYMEAIVAPVTWDDWPEAARGLFQAMRGEAGEDLVLQRNVFVEKVLPASVLGALSDEVMAEYRRPYLEPGESRRPTLTWPRMIPIDGDPADVHEAVVAYADWLADADELPTLFIDADPGSILTGRQRLFALGWPNQQVVTVPGSHFVQEDSGEQIGTAIATWLAGLGIVPPASQR
jgi:haloalkane dehalogenase